jgi:hypothetical protein
MACNGTDIASSSGVMEGYFARKIGESIERTWAVGAYRSKPLE